MARGGGNESDQDLNARHPGCHPFTVARTLPPSGAGRPAIPDYEGCPLISLDTSDDQSVARPYWESGLSAAEAHNRLGCNDPELAEVVEVVSTVLLARAEAQDDARALIGFLETQLLSADHSLRG